MIQITDKAMKVCSATVQQLSGSQTDSKCLRILKNGKRVSISFEVPRSDDEIVHHNGQSVVAVPENVAADLSGMTLDVARDGSFVFC
jgi:hypothetical protein